jgi:PAS domain S-box-containing protein
VKISHKLILSFLLVASLASVTTFFTLRSYNAISKTFATLSDDSTRSIELLTDIRHAGTRIVSSTSEIGFIGEMATGPGSEDQDEEEEQLTVLGYQAFDTSTALYAQLVEAVCPESAPELESIRRAGENLISTSKKIIQFGRQNVKGAPMRAERLRFESEETEFLALIDKSLAHESNEQANARANVEASIRLATTQTLIVTALTFLLAIFSGFYISFLISRRIRNLKEASEKVGNGELDTRIDINSKDEIGDLSRAFNKMTGDLKVSRAALAGQEKHFRSIIEKSTDGVALFAPDGMVTYASPSTPRLLGYTPDEITRMNAADILLAEDREAFREQLGKLAHEPGATAVVVNRIRHKDGSMRWLEGTFTNQLDDPDIGAIINNYRDITERKLAQEDIQRRRVELRVLFDIMPAMIWFKDTENNILRVNKRVAEAAGLTVEDIEGKPTLEIYPDEAAKFYADDLKVIRSGMPKLGYVEMLPGTDGRKLWVQTDKVPYFDKDAKPIGIVVMAQDVTERKNADEALRESEEKFRELVENANDIIYTLDLAGNFTSLNRAGEAITGYTRAEAIQKSITAIIAPEHVAGVYERFALNKQGIAQPNYELEIIAKDGRKLTLDISSRMIMQGGVPVGLQGIGRDITESLKTRNEIKIFNEKLQQSNRELQDFAYVASHDLQEPLRKVQAFSDRLRTKYADKLEGEGLDYLERMRSAANRMQMLIQDLLTFSRVSTKAQPFIPVNLETVTQEVLADLEVKIDETGATVELKGLPMIDADPTQMRQLMQNLIGNALKFHQNGVAPIISIQGHQIISNEIGGAPQCQISVTDNGIGFDEKYTDKIFAVFQRLHGRTEYEGSGVGLSICRKIAERHNGDITAHSQSGNGSTFIVTLPLNQQPELN